MLKKLLFIGLLISFSTRGQTYIKGTLASVNDYNWIALYQLKGAKQVYIANTTIAEGNFEIDFPADTASGMYRLFYDFENQGFVDFIYNNENVELKFDPSFPSGTTEFLISEQNILYNTYLKASEKVQQKLDSLQMTFLHLKEENQQQNTNKLYVNSRDRYLKLQKNFEERTIETYANSFIKSGRKYYPENPAATPQEYLNSVKQHYFDFINFKDTILINSTFLSEKVIDYVFYLNVSDDVEVQNKLYEKAANEVFQKIDENNYIKSDLLTTLLATFAQYENFVLIDYLIEKHYNKLPDEYKNSAFINEIQASVKLAVGKTAPDFSWEEKRTTKKLSDLEHAENYILVFWSTTCSHCLIEIPQLYEFTEDKTAIHVIAVALEDDELGFNHHTLNFVKWTNILGLQKWANPISRMYEITATPNYFVLDSNKKIISKPEFFVDVKDFFKD